MPNKKFRESRYLNESGSKTGNWYMNRLDYFQFNEYPEYKKHKFIAFLAGVFLIYLGLKILKTTFLGSLPFFYLGYIALLSFNLLRTKVCRYNGYFIYPKKIINFFREREIEVDLNDFDSVATMSKK
ncbi:MAG: hypothetical protein OCD00_05765 [Colwellia sp.]